MTADDYRRVLRTQADPIEYLLGFPSLAKNFGTEIRPEALAELTIVLDYVARRLADRRKNIPLISEYGFRKLAKAFQQKRESLDPADIEREFLRFAKIFIKVVAKYVPKILDSKLRNSLLRAMQTVYALAEEKGKDVSGLMEDVEVHDEILRRYHTKKATSL